VTLTPAAEDAHRPADAAGQLQVHPQLAVNLFAAEPMLSNPAAIDVDAQGRVWVCEAVNYRLFNNASVVGDRQAGDRILVLEDVDGDARADRSTVFYQGHDIDSPHGVLVLPTDDGRGTQAIVSARDSVYVLTDDDDDLRADRKDLLFTGIDGVEHDHGIHAFHFGPDGKLYFNFGNAGRRLCDKHGKPVVDRMGREVNDSRQPYQEGMVFRCNRDGSELETLAWNFRNNWELCVDSFGTIWQSDNDDDGNQACRINYVMEYGNYGYKDERSGAAWREPRTNEEPEVFRRHWRQNDPGVIPNLLHTGAGAPTGICVYEGSLLPPVFHNALLHTDAGRNVCRAYVVRPEGAGYAAEAVTVLDGSPNQWFRPSDVCVAPDGSLLVADWYDPGVGAHRMEDVRRGRLFRVTPKGPSERRYAMPKSDLLTPAGAVEALQSPNMAARAQAWTALQRFGAAAAPALHQLRSSGDPVRQARAMWLLAKLQLPAQQTATLLREVMQDQNEQLRVVGVRVARQLGDRLGFDEVKHAFNVDDPSPAVRREILLALHDMNSPGRPAAGRDEFVPQAWARLAQQYEGRDRWYLEALGIAADGRWDECLAALEQLSGPRWAKGPAGLDILWRSRAATTGRRLAAVIADPQTPAAELPRLLRALDFQPHDALQDVVADLAFDEHAALPRDRVDFIRSEALIRLQQRDLSQNPAHQVALDRVLGDCRGTAQFIKLVEAFGVVDRYGDLVTLAQAQPEAQTAADALKIVFDKHQLALVTAALASSDMLAVEALLRALATAADPRSNDLLLEVVRDEKRPLAVRRLAVRALGETLQGCQHLLEWARPQKDHQPLQDALSATLGSARWSEVRDAAAALWPPPPTKDSAPLPPIHELVVRRGDPQRGQTVFTTTGTCSKCHLARGAGTAVGPDLSEIGDKLARQAMFEAILFPSAAVSHGFDVWLLVMNDGLVHSGLLVSETDDEVKLKDDKGIVRSFPTADIDQRSRSDVSLMPADLQKLITVDELVDVVEYLATLKHQPLDAPGR